MNPNPENAGGCACAPCSCTECRCGAETVAPSPAGAASCCAPRGESKAQGRCC